MLEILVFLNLAQVQRFGTHHRSLYPRVCCARGTYILTSHVGTPVCVWDRRQAPRGTQLLRGISLDAALAAHKEGVY